MRKKELNKEKSKIGVLKSEKSQIHGFFLFNHRINGITKALTFYSY